MEPNAADVGFCQDMAVHHVQAIAMCQRVLGRDTGDSVQNAAVEVLTNQGIEVGMMRAWLADWGESTAAPELVMAWMSDDESHVCLLNQMPGYASDAEMRQLSELTGDAQGRRWLELMRAHHVGGVLMATAGAERAATTKVSRIAAAMAEVQTYEISQYDWLLDRNLT